MPTYNTRIPGAPANIMGDYMHDPRLIQGQQFAEAGSSTAPAATPLAGLARALQSGLGGLMMSQAKDEATKRTGEYNETLAQALKAGAGQTDMYDPASNKWTDASGKPNPELLAAVLSTNKDTAPMGLQFSMQNMQKAADRQADLSGKQVTTLTAEQYKAATGADLPAGAVAQKDAYGKVSILEPKQDRAAKTVNTKEGVFILKDDGTLGARLGSPVSEKDGNGGPFAGNALDAQAMNILLDPKADLASPVYRAAHSHLAAPKVSFDHNTGNIVTTNPDMSAFRPPTNGAAAPAAPGVLPSTGRPMLPNSDGSVSTELSITVTDPRLNNGQPTNIPSIWNGQRLDQGGAIDAALSSGQQFQGFKSIEEAVTAARQRSDQLGKEVAGLKPGPTGSIPQTGASIPVNGTGGVTVTPGQPRGPSPTEQAKYREGLAQASTIISSLNDFENAFKGASTFESAKSLAGVNTPENTAYNKAALLAKGDELFNLGVLNGPDLEIIRRTLPDPSTLRGQLSGNAGAANAVKQVKDLLMTRLNAKERGMGLSLSTEMDLLRGLSTAGQPASPGAGGLPPLPPGFQVQGR